ncbi:MAG TPA: bifunctional histidinol-phosphatase/imidazoleglycerol-phosphate dehydratase HisB [Chitinophagaceae bacterium]|nr:bifunctional histidinol-phosphatase/imidazoleglycerol-phosphate dehydratase HisB [Chitinophagaceae bacterium]
MKEIIENTFESIPADNGGKRILFIDRDGVILKESPPSYQVDSWEKLEFYPEVFKYLGKIADEFDYVLVMVTNQDGLGTSSFPEENFWPIHRHMIKSLEGEGISFHAVHIDKSHVEEHSPNRKPGIGMLTEYLDTTAYDIPNSFVIGDRVTDVQLAKNLGCKAVWLNNHPGLGGAEVEGTEEELRKIVELETHHWEDIYNFLKLGLRKVVHDRNTNETQIHVELNLDGNCNSSISTGIGFFDHMLEQIARHGKMDLTIQTKGDLHIDEHHTIEDTAIALGEAFAKALADKKGIERYGFALPMDDADAKLLLDFGGRNWIVWNAAFTREKIGGMPSEMFFHFFKSFSDAARCNLNIECHGENEHHKIEAIFKAFAKAIRMAVRRDPMSNYLPSTKGVL